MSAKITPPPLGNMRAASEANKLARKIAHRKMLALTSTATLVLVASSGVWRAAREIVLGSEPRFGRALQKLLGDASWQTLLAFRLGYSTHEGLRSSRRAVNEVLKV